MKEGYLQLKIQELNDKCTKIDQMIKMEKSKIELLEESVGGLKNLIKKLKDLENFKENLQKQIKKDNEENISKEIKKLSIKISEKANSTIENKIYEIGKTLGLKKNDINFIFNPSVSKQASLSLGPIWYPGSRYGAISIKEFKD